jgi:replicative DNA helicase
MRYNLEAEKGLIGSILLEKDNFIKVSKHIKSKDYFYFEKHRLLWSAISQLVLENEPVDIIMLLDKLKMEIGDDKIDVGYITALTDCVPHHSNCEHYAKLISEEHYARILLKQYTDATNRLLVGDKPFDVWSHASSKTIPTMYSDKNDYSIHDLMDNIFSSKQESDWGYSWNIKELDSVLQPLQQGKIIFIGGRPGHFKTGLILQLMDEWSSRGKKVYFQSLEMDSASIDLRRLSRISMIPLLQIQAGLKDSRNLLIPNFEQIIINAGSKVSDINKYLKINTTSGLTADQIAFNIKLSHDEFGTEIFVIDHFHEISFPGNDEAGSMNKGLSLLRSVCKERKISLIVLTQFNRGIEHESGRRPHIGDIRKCGKIDEIADFIFLMYWKYAMSREKEDMNKIEIIVAKNRDGNCGKIELPIWPAIYTIGSNKNE